MISLGYNATPMGLSISVPQGERQNALPVHLLAITSSSYSSVKVCAAISHSSYQQCLKLSSIRIVCISKLNKTKFSTFYHG